MSTIFYAESSGTAGLTPTDNTGWEDAASNLIVPMSTSPLSSAMADDDVAHNGVTNNDVLHLTGVSDELTAGQTVTGSQAISGQMRGFEVTAAAGAFSLVVRAYIVGSDLSIRKTLLAPATGGNAYDSTSMKNKTFAGTSAATDYTTVAGDRVVVQWGLRLSGAVTTVGRLRIGSAAASDLPVDDTTTTDLRPWILFADTWTFGGGTTLLPKMMAMES